MGSNQQTKHKTLVTALSVFLVAAVLVFMGWMVKAFLDGRFHSVESLQEYIKQFGAAGPLLLTLLQIMQVIIPILPGFFGCAVGSVLFGPIPGFLCNYIGIGLGSIIAFFLARRFGKPLLNQLFPEGKYHKWSEWASKSRSYSALLFLAMLLPLFPDDYLCYLTGISKMRARKFIWIIILGKPWCLLAYSIGFSFIK